MGSVLTMHDIKKLIEGADLVSNYIDLNKQLQPNGFDCTLESVWKIKGNGKIDFDNSERVIPDAEKIEFENEWVFLEKGFYRAKINEIIRLPPNLMAIARPRSSLVRCGVNVLTAVWDAGYCGRSEFGIVVYNGVWLKRNARIVQLIFIELSGETHCYSGIYQGENIHHWVEDD